jgi:hypothetical protein
MNYRPSPPTSWSLSPCAGPISNACAKGRDASRGSTLRVHSVVLFPEPNLCLNQTGRISTLAQYAEADRGEVNPAIEVESGDVVAKRHA